MTGRSPVRSDVEMAALLRAWLRNGVAELPHGGELPAAVREELLRQLDDMPQHRRRWLGRWLDGLRGATRDVRDRDTTRRNRLMFATTAAVSVATLALAASLIVPGPVAPDPAPAAPAAPASSVPSAAADGPVRVTATQICTWAAPGGVLTATCTNTASDPRVTGPGTLTMTEHVGVPGGDDYDDYLQTFEATLSEAEGTWTGRYWLVFDWPASLAYITTVLSGDGAYEGWTYVTSGTTSTSGPGPDLVGVLYEGSPPPGITTR